MKAEYRGRFTGRFANLGFLVNWANGFVSTVILFVYIDNEVENVALLARHGADCGGKRHTPQMNAFLVYMQKLNARIRGTYRRRACLPLKKVSGRTTAPGLAIDGVFTQNAPNIRTTSSKCPHSSELYSIVFSITKQAAVRN